MKRHSERKFYKIVKPLSIKYRKENRYPSRKWVNRSGNDNEPVIIGPGNDNEPVIIGPGNDNPPVIIVPEKPKPPQWDPRFPMPRYPGDPRTPNPWPDSGGETGSNPPGKVPGSIPGKTPREREPPVVVGPVKPVLDRVVSGNSMNEWVKNYPDFYNKKLYERLQIIGNDTARYGGAALTVTAPLAMFDPFFAPGAAVSYFLMAIGEEIKAAGDYMSYVDKAINW